jgi:hypothetical protein
MQQTLAHLLLTDGSRCCLSSGNRVDCASRSQRVLMIHRVFFQRAMAIRRQLIVRVESLQMMRSTSVACLRRHTSQLC